MEVLVNFFVSLYFIMTSFHIFFDTDVSHLTRRQPKLHLQYQSRLSYKSTPSISAFATTKRLLLTTHLNLYLQAWNLEFRQCTGTMKALLLRALRRVLSALLSVNVESESGVPLL